MLPNRSLTRISLSMMLFLSSLVGLVAGRGSPAWLSVGQCAAVVFDVIEHLACLVEHVDGVAGPVGHRWPLRGRRLGLSACQSISSMQRQLTCDESRVLGLGSSSSSGSNGEHQRASPSSSQAAAFWTRRGGCIRQKIALRICGSRLD